MGYLDSVAILVQQVSLSRDFTPLKEDDIADSVGEEGSKLFQSFAQRALNVGFAGFHPSCTYPPGDVAFGAISGSVFRVGEPAVAHAATYTPVSATTIVLVNRNAVVGDAVRVGCGEDGISPMNRIRLFICGG